MNKLIFLLCVPIFFFSFAAFAVIVINENGVQKTIDCNGDRVVIDGNRGQITIHGQCKEVAVDGNDNTVAIESSVAIEVDGNDNTVTYSAQVNAKPPRIVKNGLRNTVRREGMAGQEPKGVTVASGEKSVSVSTTGQSDVAVKTNDGKSVKVQQKESPSGKKEVTVANGDQAVSVGTTGGPDVTVKTNDGKSITVDAQKMVEIATEGSTASGETFMITQDDLNTTYQCNGRKIMLSGSNCRIRFQGFCGSVWVSGDDNVVTVDKTRAINVSGANNRVSWTNGERPSISNTGEDNTISHQE